MPNNCTSSILDCLTSFVVVFKLGGFMLLVLFVLSGTIISLTLLRVDPSSWRTSVENDLHFLCWVAEVEFTLISHVLEISKVASSRLFWFRESLLVQIMESCVSTLLQRDVQS